MEEPPHRPGEEFEERIHAPGSRLLDTTAEDRFLRIARIAQRAYGVEAAHVSFIDAGDQWLLAKTDRRLPDFVPRRESICAIVLADGSEAIIDDIAAAEALKDHQISRDGFWRFYAGVPLRGEAGRVVGTLCLLDTRPGTPENFDTAMLHDLAAIAGQELVSALREAELYRLTNTDALTGLANRRMFDAELLRTLRRCRRRASVASLIVLDLDHFKEVNDQAGHAAGDAALSAFAEILARHARRPDDLAARIGGEEFALILDGADVAGVASVATQLIEGIAAASLPHPVRARLSASLGLATLRESDDASTWLKRADMALYAAKAAGRATFRAA